MTIQTNPSTCPAWCDHSHAVDAAFHSTVLWSAEFDDQRLEVGVVSLDESAVDEGMPPTVALRIDEASAWMSLDMAAELAAQVYRAIVEAAQGERRVEPSRLVDAVRQQYTPDEAAYILGIKA